jgi:hypothetical protein
MAKSAPKPAPHGFILVTVDPRTSGARVGRAWNLVKSRLDAGLWPIFEATANQGRLVEGARLAFYVGGTRTHARHIVATAEVDSKVAWSYGKGSIDPPHYVTEPPAAALRLRRVTFLDPPVDFLAALPGLGMKPRNMKKWGVVLMGGCRAVTEADWRRLLG